VMSGEKIKISTKEPDGLEDLVATLLGKVNDINNNLEQMTRRIDEILSDITEDISDSKDEDEEVK
ncbi:hypothetical protein THOM_0695, partial [Trachipleistophora hominis]